jgi:2-polyprenyl-3-methyl-5-hydroxy-6-metoxy-1,4-benzoquinol methylase
MTLQVSAVKETLSHSTVHQIWEQTYRNTESERLYERVFDWIAAQEPLLGLRALDIGCGIGQHAIRLAKRGCEVVAADFSADRVTAAKENIERHGLGSRIPVCKEDLVEGLSFADGSFDIVLCWGVLMHIPQLVAAAHELVRVTRPDGRMIIYEANQFGADAMATLAATAVKKAIGRSRVRSVELEEFGTEYWTATPGGDLFVRHSNMRAVIRLFREQRCWFRLRIAGEFTEKYGFGGPVAKVAHLWNRAWFAAGHIPYLAHGNVLVFKKKGS